MGSSNTKTPFRPRRIILEIPHQTVEKAFPDPSNSPTRHTRSLSIRVSLVITSVNTGVGGWIHTSNGSVRLFVDIREFDSGGKIFLVPLHGLSSTLKSLHLAHGSSAPSSEIFGLVCFFPLLEDLALDYFDGDSEVDGWRFPRHHPNSPSGSVLRMLGGIRPIVHRLLELQSGLHFSKITMTHLREDIEPMVDLVSKRSDTLESLDICYTLTGAFSFISFYG